MKSPLRWASIPHAPRQRGINPVGITESVASNSNRADVCPSMVGSKMKAYAPSASPEYFLMKNYSSSTSTPNCRAAAAQHDVISCLISDMVQVTPAARHRGINSEWHILGISSPNPTLSHQPPPSLPESSGFGRCPFACPCVFPGATRLHPACTPLAPRMGERAQGRGG